MNIKELNEELQKYVEEYHPQIENDDRLDGMSTLQHIKEFLEDSPAGDTEIGQEFLDMERPMDGLYLGADDVSEEILYDYTFICKQIILNAAGLFDTNMDTISVFIEDCLQETMDNLEMERINISDDATQYAINALNIPDCIKDLCLALNTPLAKQVVNFIDNNEICKKAYKLALKLDRTRK